jgi:hypothetical protein
MQYYLITERAVHTGVWLVVIVAESGLVSIKVVCHGVGVT